MTLAQHCLTSQRQVQLQTMAHFPTIWLCYVACSLFAACGLRPLGSCCRPSDRDRDRDRVRGREYDRRREPSPVRPSRGVRDDDRHRAYDRDSGYNKSPPRYDRGRDRVGLGRERSPVLKRARYGRSRSPTRRSSRSTARDTRRRSVLA